MTLVLDVHCLDEPVTLTDLAQTHDAEPRTQGTHSVHNVRYWVDEAAGEIACLADAPSADGAADVHRQTHGLVAEAIYQLTEGGH